MSEDGKEAMRNHALWCYQPDSEMQNKFEGAESFITPDLNIMIWHLILNFASTSMREQIAVFPGCIPY